MKCAEHIKMLRIAHFFEKRVTCICDILVCSAHFSATNGYFHCCTTNHACTPFETVPNLGANRLALVPDGLVFSIHVSCREVFTSTAHAHTKMDN